MWILCAWWVHQNKHMGGENAESHPVLPPSVFVITIPLCALVGVWVERNNAVLQSPSTMVAEGVKRGAWKEEGLGGIQARVAFFLPTVCGKTLWGTQTRHSFTHRHYNTPAKHRRNADAWGGRGEGGWTEELFRLRRVKYGGRGALWRRCGLTCHRPNNTDEIHVISQTQTQWYQSSLLSQSRERN